jgi:hypothetical protein
LPAETETKSPVQIIKQGNKITVELAETGEVLAYCMIGDDAHVELIADLLSAKRLPRAAAKLRQMAMDARKVTVPRARNG